MIPKFLDYEIARLVRCGPGKKPDKMWQIEVEHTRRYQGKPQQIIYYVGRVMAENLKRYKWEKV